MRGGIWASIVAGVMCGALVAAGAYCPRLLGPWMIGILIGFLGTCTIFGATYRAAGMTGQWTALIATCATGIVGLTYVLVRVLTMTTDDSGTLNWALLTGNNIVLAHLWFWGTMGGTAYACKDGDGVIAECLDLMSTHVLVGRRMW